MSTTTLSHVTRKDYSLVLSVVLVWVTLAGVCAPAQADEPIFPGLKLVDEVNCGDPGDPHPFTQANVTSQIQTILGRPCRVMPTGSKARYFAYKIGVGKNLQAGKAYLLTVEYPEDAPRSMFILNNGCEQTNGFHTGNTVGDALYPKYVFNNSESLNLPLSGKYETFQMFFHLHDRFSGLKEWNGEGPRTETPADGFWVIVAQFTKTNDPTSYGAAVSRIRLYEAPGFETYSLPINFPPAELPRRHLFWREEMSDSVLTGSQPGVTRAMDWYEYKARLMKFLGMNTYCKDLLEFGHNQGWDSSPYGIPVEDLPPGYVTWQAYHAWYNYSDSAKTRWPDMISMLENYDLDVIPYYEYAGSIGQIPSVAIGTQRRCRPLGETNGLRNYTHITWTEKANCDVTDPDFREDVRKLLELTIVNYKDRKNFIGAWFRTRPSFWPVSFDDRALTRFAEQANGGIAINRAQIKADETLYQDYLSWWNDQRKAYLEWIRDYLRDAGVNEEAVVLFTWDTSEPGTSYPDWARPQVITDDGDTWAGLGQTYKLLNDAIAEDYHYYAQILPPLTWGTWEWQHAGPAPDPLNYNEVDGVMMTHTINRAYTVSSPASFEAFRTQSGLACIRHYTLNENNMEGDGDSAMLGYFVGDMNLTGPFSMMPEALAMANGDPRYIGYLASSSYNRGFPQYVRNFNQAFLALPALPSVVIPAADNPNVVVRQIDAGFKGSYLAVVNTGYTDANNVTITLPWASEVVNAATNELMEQTDLSSVTVSLYPMQLMALHIDYVNRPPHVQDMDVSFTLPKNKAVQFDLLVKDDVTPGSLLFYEVTQQPQYGHLILENGVATYLLNDEFKGEGASDSFKFTATDDSDPAETSREATVNITVIIKNEAPQAKDMSLSLFKNEPVRFNLLVGDDSTPDQLLVYTLTQQPQCGQVTIENGVATYTPGKNFKEGMDCFKFTVTDDGDPPKSSNETTVNITMSKKPVLERPDVSGGEPEEFAVSILIKGPGSGLMYLPENPQPGDPDITRIELMDTTTASTMTIRGRDNITVGEIVVLGGASMGGIIAPNVDILGDITVPGTLLKLDLRNAYSGTLRIGAPLSPKDGIDIRLEVVSDYSIETDTPIKSLSVVQWEDGGGAIVDGIIAPSIGKLTTKSRQANNRLGITQKNGDFEAALALAGSLDSASISGSLLNAIWEIGGSLGKLNVGLGIDNSRVLCDGNIGSVTTLEMFDSDLCAGVFNAVNTFGLENLFANILHPEEGGAGIGKVTIRGRKDGKWYLTNFDNSNICAYDIGTISLCNAELNAAENYGVAGVIGKGITYKDREKEKSWSWPAKKGDPAACGNSLVVLLDMSDVAYFASQECFMKDKAGDGAYPATDITAIYCRTLSDNVYIGVSTSQQIDPSLGPWVKVQLDTTSYPDSLLLLEDNDKKSNYLVTYNLETGSVRVYVGSGYTSPGVTRRISTSAMGVSTENGVVISVPLSAFGNYEYIKPTTATIYSGSDEIMDRCP